jgi:DNA-binding MarR family transcriptional regulator
MRCAAAPPSSGRSREPRSRWREPHPGCPIPPPRTCSGSPRRRCSTPCATPGRDTSRFGSGRRPGGCRWSSATTVAGFRRRGALDRAGHALDAELRRRARAEGVTPTQARVLLRVSAEPAKRRRVGALAAEFDVRQPTVSDAVAALERKGLVSRRQERRDARVVQLALTARGRRLAERMSSWDQRVRASLAPLSQVRKEAALPPSSTSSPTSTTRASSPPPGCARPAASIARATTRARTASCSRSPSSHRTYASTALSTNNAGRLPRSQRLADDCRTTLRHRAHRPGAGG